MECHAPLEICWTVTFEFTYPYPYSRPYHHPHMSWTRFWIVYGPYNDLLGVPSFMVLFSLARRSRHWFLVYKWNQMSWSIVTLHLQKSNPSHNEYFFGPTPSLDVQPFEYRMDEFQLAWLVFHLIPSQCEAQWWSLVCRCGVLGPRTPRLLIRQWRDVPHRGGIRSLPARIPIWHARYTRFQQEHDQVASILSQSLQQHDQRCFALTICVLVAYFLVCSFGLIDPMLVEIADQMAEQKNIMSLVLGETLMSLDWVQTRQTNTFGGSPLLL